ncbi:hypothetical protein LOTGIDRAFT_161769 [Lottia gigantea]|uniref:Aminotransferase class V domain-containing protein n=1 Tax=Lottia gigantea TaxID=225164 RepID=V3ZP91_LOTGI|nr:hypothetical protein LOTGIDRAFT_161769 [Lottia gigantea]ESO93218.1 hypothetical protein LOTGIDRAFT_161769 [Lottia gigantea]
MNKRDFGSFHASNVQELLSLSEEQYQAPLLPVDSGLSKLVTGDDFDFGEVARRKYFLIEEDCTFLNHGAFGGVLKPALEYAQKWQCYAEKQPLRFYDRELLPLLADVTRNLAKFINCDATDLVLISNATTALNSIIRSFKFDPGDVILMLNVTYGAVKKLIKQVCLETGAIVKEIEVKFPIEGNEQIISHTEQVLLGEKITLAVFDHIPSNTPFILPIPELVHLCHERNVPVLVDGAHVFGNIPLDIKAINADFYVSNCHKWFCCPKGAAFLYVRTEYQATIRPLVISHGFGSGFNSEFIWTGLHDYSAYLSLYTVLEFWQRIGLHDILQHNHCLAVDAGKLLVQSWKTQLMAPENMFGSMVLVELPAQRDRDKITYDDAEAIQNTLYHNYNIEVPIKVVGKRLCVRISAHIYNRIEEYEKLAKAILEICDSSS